MLIKLWGLEIKQVHLRVQNNFEKYLSFSGLQCNEFQRNFTAMFNPKQLKFEIQNILLRIDPGMISIVSN